LQELTTSLSAIRLSEMPYDAVSFMEDLRQKVATEFPGQPEVFHWEVKVTGGQLQVDPQLLQAAFLEIFDNALRHERSSGEIAVTAEVQGGQLIVTLREPKAAFNRSTEKWGQEPFKRVHHGHYGLGLHRARSILEAHRGQLNARYDSAASILVTTIVLPVSEVS
jgi:K+-sensing histidine kinase KdpD